MKHIRYKPIEWEKGKLLHSDWNYNTNGFKSTTRLTLGCATFCSLQNFTQFTFENPTTWCRGRNWCLYLRCWEANLKLDYGLLRWYSKAFSVMTKPIQARNKGCTWQNNNKSPMKNTLQYLISTLMVLVR